MQRKMRLEAPGEVAAGDFAEILCAVREWRRVLYNENPEP